VFWADAGVESESAKIARGIGPVQWVLRMTSSCVLRASPSGHDWGILAMGGNSQRNARYE